MEIKFHNITKQRSVKSTFKAEKILNVATALCQNGKLYESLIACNDSLCHAESELQLGNSYAKRSEIYFESNMYDECIENINLARINNFHDQQSLDEREEKCREKIEAFGPNKNFDPWSFFKLSHPANKKIPFIINSLELRESSPLGRHVITEIDLKPGDVIAIEEPFFRVNSNLGRHAHCNFCLKSNKLNLIPCTSCSKEMFCSNDCLEKDFSHPAGCNLPYYPEFCKLLYEAVTKIGDLETIQTLLSSATEPKTIFDFDLSHPENPSRHSHLLLAFQSLASKMYLRPSSSSFKTVFTKMPLIKELVKSADDEDFVMNFFDSFCRIYKMKAIKLRKDEKEVKNRPQSTFKNVGLGVLLFGSLLSRSHRPNVALNTVENKVAFVVIRSIQKGEQIFIAYDNFKNTQGKLSVENGTLMGEPFYHDKQNLIEKFHLNCRCIDNIPDNRPNEEAVLIDRCSQLLRGIAALHITKHQPND